MKRNVILEGDTSKQEMKAITARGLGNYLLKTTHEVLVQLFSVNTDTQHNEVTDSQILAVLARYEGIFVEPKGLPPKEE